MSEHKKKIEAACEMLHTCFKDEANDYSQREDSDVEYFIGVIMYNLFCFSKALSSMRTMDVGSDFARAAGRPYIEACELIDTIRSDDEPELLSLLQDHIELSLQKYDSDPASCYLLNRLKNHIDTLAGIYAGEVNVDDVDFNKSRGFGN